MMEFVTKEYARKVAEENPRPLNELGEFVYYRTYSRWLPEENRREYWWETCWRAVNFNVGLAYKHLKKIGFRPNVKELKEEARKLFDNMYHTKQFLSGRTLWIGGAPNNVGEKFALANFNCSFLNISSWSDLGDLFYLLLVGRV